MESIAKMQPHLVFEKDYSLSAKMKLPDGTVTQQKIGTYTIENGNIVSNYFETNTYLQNNQLIIEKPSQDNKQIYEKIK